MHLCWMLRREVCVCGKRLCTDVGLERPVHLHTCSFFVCMVHAVKSAAVAAVKSLILVLNL